MKHPIKPYYLLFEDISIWYWKNYTQMQIAVFGLASFTLYGSLSSLFGHFWLFAIVFVLLLILGGISFALLIDEEEFLLSKEDDGDSLWNSVLFKTMDDWFCRNELWNKYLENELRWYQKILFYVPFTAFLALALVTMIFIGIFDNMRHDLKKFDL
jgi:hypothetical protein